MAAVWMLHRAVEVKYHLSTAGSLASQIKLQIASGNGPEARRLLDQVKDHTSAARAAASDPLWRAASYIPLLGENSKAVSEVSEAADSVVGAAGAPLLDIFDRLSSGTANPVNGSLDISQLQQATAGIAPAALAVETATAKLENLNKRNLLPQISAPLGEVIQLLRDANGPLKAAGDASRVMPSMLGSDEPRNYLLLVQNNAEIRATGGLPGALAVVRIDKGKIQLTAQVSGKELGKFIPSVTVPAEDETIYSTRVGSYISDVNLTPDFPIVAQTAKTMWELRYGTPIDGVVAIDPIVLSHVLSASGPLPLPSPTGQAGQGNLPSTLTAENVVKTLLSDVYVTMAYGEQDQFFAAAARQVFDAIAAGTVPVVPLVKALAESTEENRLHVWSRREAEQQIMVSSRLGGSISLPPNAGQNSFGVFFNDGTGAKMDYYARRTVQLIKECPSEGYEETTVRVTSSNVAPADASITLPPYVTGAGIFGVAPGTIQTNIAAYGPAEANVEAAIIEGQKVPFASYVHANRPVGVVAQKLAPGESKTVEFTFRKIVQHTEPSLVVTPTVQPVKDVILPTEKAACR